jgi:tRNA pseudouridine38-40 synthase
MNQNILLVIEYDGSAFCGWQVQPDVRTVQGVLEDALSRVMCERIRLSGASRTDTGVHALGAAANFRTSSAIPAERIPLAVNNLLSDVRITSARQVPDGFHARAAAKRKTYLYRICVPRPGGQPDIFMNNYRYWLNKRPDEGKMREAAGHLVGTHDFSAFRSASKDAPESAVRTIQALHVETHCATGAKGETLDEISIRVAGDGFLYNMVRIIAGTLVDVGLGKMGADGIPNIIASRDRRRAGHTAPAAGLYLAQVEF